MGSSLGTWGCVGFKSGGEGGTQDEKTSWSRAPLTTQVDSVEEDKAGVAGQAV